MEEKKFYKNGEPAMEMNLTKLGLTEQYKKIIQDNNPEGFDTGRVIAEHRERYRVMTSTGEYEGEITGNLRFTARDREDFPAVGDWVTLTTFNPGDPAIIHRIMPRRSLIKREAPGEPGTVQVIASNIDYGLLVQATDRDFSINRLERYITLCRSARVIPIIVITKTDLAGEQRTQELTDSIRKRVEDVPVIAVSNITRTGYDTLTTLLEPGKTFCLLGSSGAGKSTLLNNLAGSDIMSTGAISTSSERGRHITSHRELFLLESGAIVIDNPGMREVGMADAATGLQGTFDRIYELAERCRFKDCTHTEETGCAVIAAAENGDIDQNALDNFLKLQREQAHYEATVAEKRRKGKQFARIVKDMKKKDIKQRGS
jgi:ribosome biogenesis GTPase